MTFVIPPPRQVSVGIEGEDGRFPVRRIYCVGRNYAAHAKEMGSNPEREPPFFFTKPADAVLEAPAGQGTVMQYPMETMNLHHEVELVVALKSGGRDIAEDEALNHVFGYGVGLDMTRRDLQAEAKKTGRPWDLAKGFDESAPMGPIRRAQHGYHPSSGRIWLEVNGNVRQEGDVSDMIWSVPEVISVLSASVALEPGDLIFTGTPAGVGPVVPGEMIRGSVEDVGQVEIHIGEPYPAGESDRRAKRTMP